MANDIQYQLVTFHLGEELYGVNIMDVKEIVRLQNVRVIPNAPYYVEGIINLRGEIIPIIDLHKRFKIQSTNKSEDIEMEGGFIISFSWPMPTPSPAPKVWKRCSRPPRPAKSSWTTTSTPTPPASASSSPPPTFPLPQSLSTGLSKHGRKRCPLPSERR